MKMRVSEPREAEWGKIKDVSHSSKVPLRRQKLQKTRMST